MLENLIDFSMHTHEKIAPVPVIYHTGNGDIKATIIAYSLGATQAFCIIGLDADRLSAGNFSCCWLPVSRLTFVFTSRS